MKDNEVPWLSFGKIYSETFIYPIKFLYLNVAKCNSMTLHRLYQIFF